MLNIIKLIKKFALTVLKLNKYLLIDMTALILKTVILLNFIYPNNIILLIQAPGIY